MEILDFSPFEVLFARDDRGQLSLLKSAWKPIIKAKQARTKSNAWYH
jgi:hypothetical protein